jgi:hypothetical protein
MTRMSAISIALAVFLISTPILSAQDLSKYRGFYLGTRLADVEKRIGDPSAVAKVVEKKPALIQELTWRPSQPHQFSAPMDPVEETLFSFYDGELYKIAVTYDTTATKGLTPADMIGAISSKYGLASLPVAKKISANVTDYSDHAEIIASWEDAQHFVTLLQSPVLDGFQLVMFSKEMNSHADAAIAAAANQAREDAPQIEVARAKQETADLEAARQANLKAFRP